VLLADEMGLGKTAQALAIIAQYLDAEGPALVVTPSSLGGVWKEQTRRWLPQLLASDVQLIRGMQDLPLPTARIVIVSYAIFVRGAARLSKRLHGDPWKIVVCDEAHYLKNPASQRGTILLPMLQACNRAVLVTGTPTPKQASEAYSLLHALRPMQCPFKEWCDRYGTGQTERREAEVAALLSEVMIRRMKTEVLDQLPEKIRQRICLQLPVGKTGTMKKLQQEAREGSRVSDEQHFKQLSELKEVAAQDYVEYLLDACNDKFLLFGHHRSMLDALEKTIVKRRVGLPSVGATRLCAGLRRALF
jgi:SNF2 family DNA or RNA helicase